MTNPLDLSKINGIDHYLQDTDALQNLNEDIISETTFFCVGKPKPPLPHLETKEVEPTDIKSNTLQKKLS